MTETARKPVAFWLIASVLVNMILIGLVAGILLRPGHGPAQGRERPFVAGQAADEDRRAVRAVMATGIQASQAEIEARRQSETAMVALLRAEPYDPVAAAAALAAFREADCKARDAAAAAIFSELAELTPEQRALAVRVLGSGSDRRRGRYRGGRDDAAPPQPPTP